MLSQDQRFMAAALRLGRHHLGRTGTNPSVATLIVQGVGENAVIVGRGITGDGGKMHSEPLALQEAGEKAKGATAYVTLEPCAHRQHAKACCDALIEAKIARLVTTIADVNPTINGKSIEKLRSVGIEVVQDICAQQAARDHAGHILRMAEKRPFVQMKMALTANGIIGNSIGRLMVTNEVAQVYTQSLRTQCDAIAIGIGTALADDPLLTCRLPGLEHRSPHRLVFDRSLRLPLSARLVATAADVSLTLLTRQDADADKISQLRKHSVNVEQIDGDDGAFIKNALLRISELGFTRILVEAGAGLARALIAQDLVDQALLIESTKGYDGDDAIVGVSMQDWQRLTASPDFEIEADSMLGEDRLRSFWRTRTCLQG